MAQKIFEKEIIFRASEGRLVIWPSTLPVNHGWEVDVLSAVTFEGWGWRIVSGFRSRLFPMLVCGSNSEAISAVVSWQFAGGGAIIKPSKKRIIINICFIVVDKLIDEIF